MATRPKFAQLAKTFLKSPITSTETSAITVGGVKDIYGNNVTASALGGRLRFTISPGNADEEIGYCTSYTLSSDGTYVTFDTGITRANQAIYPYTGSGTASAHSAGTQVVLLPDNPHLYEEILLYIDGLVLAAAVPATDTTVGYTKLTESIQAPRAMGALVSQQASPDKTVHVNPFAITSLDKIISYTGGNTTAITAPVTNPRIDLVIYDSVNGVINVRTGTEGASPSEPTPTAGDIVLASMYLRVGTTAIYERDDSVSTHGYIKRWYQPAIYKSTYFDSSAIFTSKTDQTQTTQDTSSIVGAANTTGLRNKLAQSFTSAHAAIKGVALYKVADTGSFTGTVTIALQGDTAGSPSGSNLASITIPNATWLLMPAAAEFEAVFTAEYTTTVGTTYWIVISTSTSDTSNHPNIGINSAGGYASGSSKYNNTTDGWVAISVVDLYFKTLQGTVSQIPGTDSSGNTIDQGFLPYSFVEFNNAITLVSNSSGVATVYTKVLPAGFFKANSGFKLKGYFDSIVLTGEGITIAVELNGTNLISLTCMNGGASALSGAGEIEFHMVNNNSLSAQKSVLKFVAITTTNSTASLASEFNPLSATSAINTAGICVLKVKVNMTGNSSCLFNYMATILEKIGL